MSPYLLLWGVMTSLTVSHALKVGAGIFDVTGPPAEVIFMGYANFEQVGTGLHLRQFARAFAFEDENTRFVFVSVDASMMSYGVKREVLNKLQRRFGNIYNDDNVIISGTHSHSTPGGFMMDFLFDLPIFGFVKETFNSYVVGIYRSIVQAHINLEPALVQFSEGLLLDANINRSPSSYLRNPKEERDRYTYDVDKKLSQVKFLSLDHGNTIGVINWFAVHPTSMNNTNRLISSDNVGYASILMEKALNGNQTLPGKGQIVCAFASTNLGDVSPNTKGPKCEFSGVPCDQEKKLCKGHNERCFASGPGKDMFDSTRIIATKLFDTAMEVYKDHGEDLTGPLGIIHQYVDMPHEEVLAYDPVTEKFIQNKTVSGCIPAMGYSFAAGTTDGPGAFDFTQGTTSGNPLWNAVRDFLATPTEEDVTCHSPKPILLATGRMVFPYEWQPQIVSCTVARIGGLFLAAVPGEFTTMSGRRLRNIVLKASGGLAQKVVIAGLSNIYSDYVATYEEYQAQRYEAASTVYGPHTLEIYLNKYYELTKNLVQKQPVSQGPSPPDLSGSLISLVTPVVWDTAPWKHEFGDCLHQPQADYSHGDLVEAVFVSGHPRNGMRHGRWYLAVEKLETPEDDSWTVVATDADWETKFIWRRENTILGTSSAIVQWEIPVDTPKGTYRLHHYGSYKYIFGGIYPYHGFTNSFEVT